MGHIIGKLSEKYLSSEDPSNKQESRGMLSDITIDDNDVSLASNQNDSSDMLEGIAKTPPNIVKLRCDPRSPTNFDRTPLKVPEENSIKQ